MKTIYHFTLCCILILNACSKSDDNNSSSSSSNNNGGSSNTLAIDSHWQVKVTIGGTAYSKIDGSGTAGAFTDNTSSSQDPDTTIYNYGSSLVDPTFTFAYFEVLRNGHHYQSGAVVENADFKSYFTPGNYPFTAEGVNGVAIRWTDSNGDLWGTDMGSGDQTGSVFTIVQVKEETVLPNYDLKVLSHFHCKLYNNSGQSKDLTDGEYVSLFEAM